MLGLNTSRAVAMQKQSLNPCEFPVYRMHTFSKPQRGLYSVGQPIV
ncbi:hypothetical protein GGQ18_000024 [Salinibacter ruber]|nr:hypothetical protein [Salinibacter ruber]